jgi:hypothetical protein
MYICYKNFALELSVGKEFFLLKDFLKQYFCPYFDFVEKLDENFEEIGKLILSLDKPKDEIKFDLNSQITIDASKGFLSLSGYVGFSDSNDRWVKLDPYDCTISFLNKSNTVKLYGENISQFRIPTLRLIEDVFSNHLQNNGCFLVHASAVSVENKIILFVGNKGAGKTTTLTRCLGHFNCEKIANDNVVLWMEEGQLMARGWPAFFKVQAGTIATTTELIGDFPLHAQEALFSSEEALWNHYEKVPLYPQQAANRFGTTIKAEGKVSLLIFPQFTLDSPPQILDIEEDVFVNEFKQFLQGINNPNHPDWMLFNSVNKKEFEQAYIKFIHTVQSLDSVSKLKLLWAPSLEDMLRRVPELREQNKKLKQARNTLKQDRVSEHWQELFNVR